MTRALFALAAVLPPAIPLRAGQAPRVVEYQIPRPYNFPHDPAIGPDGMGLVHGPERQLHRPTQPGER
jgi:hypothetical protein